MIGSASIGDLVGVEILGVKPFEIGGDAALADAFGDRVAVAFSSPVV
jgi:hypothetical protein